MNCKNSAQNALKGAIFRLKIEKFSGEGQCPLPRPLPIGEGIPPPQTLLPRRLRLTVALDEQKENEIKNSLHDIQFQRRYTKINFK